MRSKEAKKIKARSIEEQAAGWLLEFEDGNPEESVRRAFVHWLKESPRHIEEFLEISAIHLALCESAELADTIDELLVQASGNVVQLDDNEPEPTRRGPSGKGSRFSAIAASVLFVITAGFLYLGGFSQGPEFDGVVYQTNVGEQRSIVLSDNSTLTLNTLSKVSVKFTESGRHVSLVEGEAMFDVSKDADRPFTVEAGFLDVLVVGTVFNIRRHEGQAILTVVEGKVGVQVHQVGLTKLDSLPVSEKRESSDPFADRVPVIAGEQVAVADIGMLEQAIEPNIQNVTAWMQQRLVFDNDSLAYVFEEFNRYNHQKLVVNNPELSNRKVTGSFDARDTKSFLQFIQSQSDVSIIHTPSTIVVSELR